MVLEDVREEVVGTTVKGLSLASIPSGLPAEAAAVSDSPPAARPHLPLVDSPMRAPSSSPTDPDAVPEDPAALAPAIDPDSEPPQDNRQAEAIRTAVSTTLATSDDATLVNAEGEPEADDDPVHMDVDNASPVDPPGLVDPAPPTRSPTIPFCMDADDAPAPPLFAIST